MQGNDDEIPDKITELKIDLAKKRFFFRPGIIPKVISSFIYTPLSIKNIQSKIKTDSLKGLENNLIQVIRRNVMKTFLGICFLVAFIGLLYIGCSDKSITPVETTANNSPVTLQKDTGPGAWIIKYDYKGAFWLIDWETGAVIILGMESDPWSFCSGIREVEMFTWKDIILPNADPELRRIIERVMGKELTATIWYIDPFPASWVSFCTFWNQVEPMEPFAVGTANFGYRDTDLYSNLRENNNSNVWSFKVNGNLLGQDGIVYKLNYIDFGTWDGEDGSRHHETHKLQLTPTGKK